MIYKEPELENQNEINSVSSFISEIKSLRESNEGYSTELYFRGQETEFWDIEPSIFRDDMLSVEHKLMQIPLQKIPMEFKEFNTTFDIMTKYQHYGMCTRLLDLTTNPLVALYFACKIHGNKEYNTEDGVINHEPYGVIYYTKNYYPSLPTEQGVKIVSALASYDLSKQNTICDILKKLRQDHIIDEETMTHWMDNNYTKEFIDTIQMNYMVIPTYTNERLRKQNGVFLLASTFTINSGTDIKQAIITKTKSDLRDAFSPSYFYIEGENKESILKELDLYTINEATLFSELEHQLSYIKTINKEKVQSVSDFSKYYEGDVIISDKYLNFEDAKLNEELLKDLDNILAGIVDFDDLDKITKLIEDSLSIDWYKRPSVQSKLKMKISGYYFEKSHNRNEATKQAQRIIDLLNNEVDKHYSIKI